MYMFVYILTIYCIFVYRIYITEKKKFIIRRISFKHTRTGLCTRVYKMRIAWRMPQSH